MTTRNPLRGQLEKAWRSTINKNYREQLINSEHGLQIYFCAALLKEFKKTRLRLFIAPRLSFPGHNSTIKRYPDIVICNSKSIIGIVEIKYGPRVKLADKGHKKDLDTLRMALEHADTLTISNDRFRGVTKDNRKYPLAKDAVLCWAGVYAGEEINLRKVIDNGAFRERFLQLSALTVDGEHPNVVRS